MLVIGGVVNAIYGMVAIVNDTWIVWNNQDALLVDFTVWGWIGLTLGVIAVLAGLGLLTGSPIARATAAGLAALSLVANFLFLPAFPLWALSVMVIDGLVIYAVTAHGGERRVRGENEAIIDVRAQAPKMTAATDDRARTTSAP
jgi:hypothetical protein